MQTFTFKLIVVLLLCQNIFAIQDSGSTSIKAKILLAKDMGIGGSMEKAGTELEAMITADGLSIQIGRAFEDVELAAGMAIKPEGYPCFFMSMSDGIDLGAISVQGDPYSLARVVPNTSFNASLELSPEICFNWIDNKAMTFKPKNLKYQKLLSLPNTVMNLLDFIRNLIKLDLSPSFTIEMEGERGKIKVLESDKIKGIELEGYCLEQLKEVPDTHVNYELFNNEAIIEDSKELMKDSTLNEETIWDINPLQKAIWKKELLDNFSKVYLTKVEINFMNELNRDYQYAHFNFNNIISIYYYPSLGEESYYSLLYKNSMVLDEGGMLFVNDENHVYLQKFQELNLLNLASLWFN